MKTFGERVRQARMLKGWSQDELARKLGYKHKTSISNIENGKQTLNHEQATVMASVLGVTPMYLMGWDTEKTVQAKYDLLSPANQQTVLNLINFLLAEQEAKK